MSSEHCGALTAMTVACTMPAGHDPAAVRHYGEADARFTDAEVGSVVVSPQEMVALRRFVALARDEWPDDMLPLAALPSWAKDDAQ